MATLRQDCGRERAIWMINRKQAQVAPVLVEPEVWATPGMQLLDRQHAGGVVGARREIGVACQKSWQIFAPVSPQLRRWVSYCHAISPVVNFWWNSLWFGPRLPATCLDLTLLGLAENNYYNQSHFVEFYIPSFTRKAFHPRSEDKHAYYETTLILERIKQLTRHWAPFPENSGRKFQGLWDQFP